MKKHIGAIVFFTIAVLYGLYYLISSICRHARPIAIILSAILLIIFAAQLYLTLKGARMEDDQNNER